MMALDFPAQALAHDVVRAIGLDSDDTLAAGGAIEPAAHLDELRRAVEVLLAALDLDHAEVALAHLGWLRRMLTSRCVPLRHLHRLLEMLPGAARGWLTAAQARQLRRLSEEARAAVDAAAPDGDVPPEAAGGPGVPADAMARALLEGARSKAAALLSEAVRKGEGYCAAAVGLMQPAMYEIGRLWEGNRISVADEHLATGVAQTVLARAFLMAEFAPESGRRALLACVPGNQHSLGLRLVADCFEIAGWETRCLGADTPADALLAQSRDWSPRVLGLSISLITQIPAARTLIHKVRESQGPGAPTVLVGGLATNQLPGVAELIGADAWAADAVRALGGSGD